ncbi:MAG: FapA family protein [Candidatus Wallbacteria bacterium]|nr:FapA family protein [Candidatus Wallbacteria bacterium]
MTNQLIMEAPSIEECLKKACVELKCQKEDLDFEVLAEGKKGLFGLVSQNFKLRVLLKKTLLSDEEKIDKVLDDVQKLAVEINGYCDIRRENDGIFLIITPPRGKGSRITLDQAAKFVEEYGIVNVDFDAISEAVNRSDEKPVRIAEFDPAVYKDGEAQLILSKDLMTMELILVSPKGGNPVSFEQVMDLIRENGVKVKLKENEIKEAISGNIYNKAIVIAEGTPPKNGSDARIEYKFKPKKDKLAPSLRDDGGVDFKKLNLIDNIVKGEKIGEKIAATPGEPGQNLLGELVNAIPGRDIMLIPGKNVVLGADGLTLIAMIDGQVCFKKNVLNVMPVLTVAGDVDYASGDLDFAGNVVVKENILDGFTVSSKGDIDVGKTIGASYVEATGDIVVMGGILGKDKGEIKCGGSLFAKFIENCSIEAKEEVIVERAIMHSRVKAKRVIVTSSKGLIVGGEIQAEDEVEATAIGSTMATKTSIILGTSRELLQRMADLDKACKETVANLTKVNQAVGMIQKLKERSGELNEENQNKLNKTLAIKKQLDVTMKEQDESKTKLDEQLESARGGKIKVQKVIYPGVTVTIGKSVLQVKEEIKSACLVYEEGYVKIKPYA